jgi:tRNA (guanine37-N1)-methyltransferase
LRKRLKEKLSATLPTEELEQVYDSFDIIGDIAIFKTSKSNTASAQTVANKIMAIHRNVKTVFIQTSPISGDFRVRELKLAAGESKTSTIYKEAGCVFAVDVEKCYFSPRLLYERSRIASLVNSGETVVNMFAGVGCFSIIIAKTVTQSKVFSIDVNPVAGKYMAENIRVNRLYGKVIPMVGDSKEIITAKLEGIADRVLMPLPEKALEYLPYAVLALKKSGGWIHYYDFQHAVGSEDPVEKTKLKVAQKLDILGVDYFLASSRIVRSTGPNWYQIVLDIQVSSLPNKF